MNEQEMQEKYLQFQMLMQQSQHLEQAVTTINSQIEELNTLKQNLEDISKVEEGNDILVPMGAGIFLKAKSDNTKELLMNVGSKVIVKKSPQEALKLIDEQIKEMTKVRDDSQKESIRIAGEQQSLQEELQKVMASQES